LSLNKNSEFRYRDIRVIVSKSPCMESSNVSYNLKTTGIAILFFFYIKKIGY